MSTMTVDILKQMPVVAILRGLQPENAQDVGEVLVGAGFKAIEVPLNRPNAIQSIEILVNSFGSEAMFGAGTVLTKSSVDDAAKVGAQLIVSPNTNPDVIAHTNNCGLLSVPGFSSATEAFDAIAAGADALKLFPFSAAKEPELKAMSDVLPSEVPVLCVGGVTPQSYHSVIAAGGHGVGLGGALFKPTYTIDEIATRAKVAIDNWKSLRQ